MRKTKKILLEEQAARLDAKQILARDFSPDILLRRISGSHRALAERKKT
jgi:hypothetical protein